MLLRFNLFSMSAMQQPFRVFERCLKTLLMLERKIASGCLWKLSKDQMRVICNQTAHHMGHDKQDADKRQTFVDRL